MRCSIVFLAPLGLLVTMAACSTLESDTPSPAPLDNEDPAPTPDPAPDAGGDGSTDETVIPEGPDPGPPHVDVGVVGSYGTHTFEVPGNAYWVNSGLYLRAGETAEVTVEGTWDTTAKDLGPEGGTTAGRGGCKDGGLVARSELHYADNALYCIGRKTTIAAVRDGIVYFGSLIDTDLAADSYERRRDFKGALRVTVTSTGKTVPWVPAAKAPGFPFNEAQAQGSGQIEFSGKHVTVVASVAQALADKDGIAPSIALLDALYELHAELRGMTPFGGQRIRFVTDTAINDIGYMIAGNPIRMRPDVFTGRAGREHLLRSDDPKYDVWGFAHELGHTFAITPGDNWWYQVGRFLEAWPNIFSVHALRKLGRASTQWGGSDPTFQSAKICPNRASFLASSSYELLTSDDRLTLCFLLAFDDAYGKDFYKEFFAKLNAVPPNGVPSRDNDGRATWGWLRDRFSEIAKTDVTPIFTQWRVPLPD